MIGNDSLDGYCQLTGLCTLSVLKMMRKIPSPVCSATSWVYEWMDECMLLCCHLQQKKIFQSYPWNDMLSKFTHMHLTLKWCPKASWASPSKHCGCIFFVVIRNFMENVKLPIWYGKSPWKMWNSSVSSKVLLTAHAWRIAWKTCMQLRDPYSRAGENNTGSGGCGLC